MYILHLVYKIWNNISVIIIKFTPYTRIFFYFDRILLVCYAQLYCFIDKRFQLNLKTNNMIKTLAESTETL
jgi:hypothetical protein